MYYSDFLSWGYETQNQANPFQFIIKNYGLFDNHKEYFISDENLKLISVIEDQLTQKYFYFLGINTPSTNVSFLEYHYSQFQGNKIDFLWFIENSFAHPPFLASDYGSFNSEVQHYWKKVNLPHNKKPLLEWIEKKRSELTGEKPQTETKKRKPPTLNEYNRPGLTQKQTAILFKLFKDHNLFIIQGLTQNRYEEIVSQLTGYSNNTLHQDFSAKDLLSISDKPDDYKMIIAKLQEIIEKLKENIV